MAHNEEDIVKVLMDRFDGLTMEIQRERRVWLNAPREVFIEVLTFIHDELDFDLLCTATGLDTGEEYQLIYHLSHDNGIVLNARVCAPHADPTFDTATDIYKGGILCELEARNLLGLNIRGIPEDIIYPLPDKWPEGEYPLRKGWINPADRKEGEEGAAAEGAATTAAAEGATPEDEKAAKRAAAKARAAAKRAANAASRGEAAPAGGAGAGAQGEDTKSGEAIVKEGD